MTRMVCLICTCTVMCNLPKGILKVADFRGELSLLRGLVTFLYWSQFSGDFIIYAASNKQYREAYMLLISDAWSAFKKCCGESEEEEEPNHLALVVMLGNQRN